MATSDTKVPSIYNVPPNADPELKRFAESVKEALEVRLGRRGDPKDRAITLRELIGSGLAKELLDNPFDPNTGIGATDFEPNVETDSTMPPTPTGFSVSAAYSSFILSWDSAQFNGLAYTEIWRSDSDDRGAAIRVDTTRAFVWTEEVGYNATYFYWVRHVSSSDVVGPFSPSGTGTTAVDIGAVMTTLSETLAGLPGYSVLTDADAAHGVNITNLQNDAGAAYVLQVNANGAVAGMVIENNAYGAADNSGSAIQFKADKFAIWNATGTDAGDTAVAPFIVDDDVVYIDTARIKNASIAAAKIGSVNADTITTGGMSAARITSGTMSANRITTNTLNVAGLAVDGTLGAMFADAGTKTFSNSNYTGSSTTYATPELLCTPLTLTIPVTANSTAKTFLIRLSATPTGTNEVTGGGYYTAYNSWTNAGVIIGGYTAIRAQVGYATTSNITSPTASPFFSGGSINGTYARRYSQATFAESLTISHKISITTSSSSTTTVYIYGFGGLFGIVNPGMDYTLSVEGLYA